MDVEFAVQAGLLATGLAGARAPGAAIPQLVKAGWISAGEGALLAEAHGLAMALQQVERVALDRPFDPEKAGRGLKAAMARAGGEADFAALEARLAAVQGRAAQAATAALAERG
jgi:glutamate-ammonia-ligase adenylyltransferase